MFKKNLLEDITLIIIPNSSRNTFNFKLNKKLIFIIVGIATAVFLYFMGLSFKYFSSQADRQNIKQIKEESQAKDKTIETLNSEMEKLQNKQNEIEQKQEQIKKLMGINTTGASESEGTFTGKGGEDINYAITKDNFTQMNQLYMEDLRTTELELSEMLKKLEGNQDYYRGMPNQWPTQGEITSTYGMRKSPFGGNSYSFHDGLDIANQTGTPILAAADGKVTFAGYMPVYGRTILIEHSNAFSTKYGHNSVLLVNAGEEVKKGQVIAKMGNTGRSTGPHLHFSIYKEGQSQNPLLFLP